jgi:acetyl-CoA carboxylase carboxyl transferase subunit alpha
MIEEARGQSKPMQVLEFERPIVDLEQKIEELRSMSTDSVDFSAEIQKLQQKAVKLQKEVFSGLSPHQQVQLSRHAARPTTLDYVSMLFDDYMELHGDRAFRDDQAILGGMATFEGEEVLVIGHQKGRNTKENVMRNFGMSRPEGYRKCIRLMEMAARFERPILCFVDTAGAYPGIGAEERGQAEAIAKSLEVMARLKTPIISTVIGEGGSGGALAIGVADRVLMLEYSVYSVITPEGCASILWRDPGKAADAAAQLKLRARDLLELGICDQVIDEPIGGAHRAPEATAESLRGALSSQLGDLLKLTGTELIDQRYEKFRRIGAFREAAANKK